MKSAVKCIILAAAALFALPGCKSVPTPDQMKTTATSIGVAAGFVADSLKPNDKTRNTVVAIVEEVARVTPKSGQSFADAWTPVAQSIVDKLVADGKIDAATGQLAMTAFGVAVKGVDYIFDIRYPKARQYEELVAAAVAGFTEGFLSVFKPVDATKATAAEAKPLAEPDAEALKWLKENALPKSK